MTIRLYIYIQREREREREIWIQVTPDVTSQELHNFQTVDFYEI